MWSYCSSLVSAAESLHCIRISALLLNLEGSDEFRHGIERWVHSAVPGEFSVLIQPSLTAVLARQGNELLAAIRFQLGNGPQHHQGLVTLAQPKLPSPKAMNGQLCLGCWGSSGHLSASSGAFQYSPSHGPGEVQNELPLFTGSLEEFGNELH